MSTIRDAGETVGTGLYIESFTATQINGDFGTVALRGGWAHGVAASATVIGLSSIIVLAIFTQYARHVTAVGKIIPNGGLSSIVSLSAGVVEKEFVADGSSVKAGDPIIRIDVGTHSVSGEVSELLQQKMLAEKALLIQQRKYRISQYNIERAMLVKQEDMLLGEQKNQHAAGMRQDAVIAEMHRELNILRSERSLGISKNQDVQTQLFSIAEASVARTQLFEAEASTVGQKLTTEQKIADEPDALATDLAKINTEIIDLDEKIVSNEPRHTVDIIATMPGTVSALTIRVGEPIKESQQLAVILPKTLKLIAQVYVDDAGASHLQQGATVNLELAAFPKERYGLLAGHIKAISRAPASSEDTAHPQQEDNRQVKNGSDEADQKSRYRVWISLDAQTMNVQGQEMNIPVGSMVTAHLTEEKRSLIRWLFESNHRADDIKQDFSVKFPRW